MDGARLEMSDVPDHAVVPDDRRILGGRVDHRVVLDARASADDDVSVVAAQDGTWPDGRFRTDSHVADHHRVGMDESRRIDTRNEVSKGIQGHGTTVVPGGIRLAPPVP